MREARTYDPVIVRPASERRLVVDDLYSLPEGRVKYELEAGLLLSEPHPGMQHGRVAAAVAEILRSHVRRHGLGVVLGNDTWFVLARSPDTVRGPDVAFVVRKRFERVGDLTTAFPGAPDLAVEVVSPSTTRASLHGKIADYLSAGTACVWVVDPASQTVTVYRSLLSPRTIEAGKMLDGGDVVPEFRVPVELLFEI